MSWINVCYNLEFQGEIAIVNVNTGGINYEGPTAPAKLYMKVGEDDGGAYCTLI